MLQQEPIRTTQTNAWSLLFLLWACGACLRLTILAVPPVITIIQHDLYLSGTQIGLLTGIPVVLFALAAAPGSTLVGRLGVRRALLIGLAVTAAGGALRALATSSWGLYLTSIIMSAGVAIMQPVMAASVRAWVPERAAFGTALYTNCLIMGEVIPVALMIPFVLPLTGTWRAGLGAWSVPVVATFVCVLILTPKSTMSAVTKAHLRWLPDLGSWLNWRIGLVLGSVASTYFSTNGFLPTYLNGNGHPELVSTALTALNLGQFPTSFLLLFVADKMQGRLLPYSLLGLSMVACVIGIMCTASGWTVFWAALLGGVCGAALALSLALAPMLCRDPDEVAGTSAAAFAVSYGCAMLVSFTSGVSWDLAHNVDAAFIPIVIGTLPMLIVPPMLRLRRKWRQDFGPRQR